MTISVANLDANVASFGDWFNKTNTLSDALTNDILTLGSNENTGNTVINGAVQTTSLYATSMYGGEIGNTTAVTFQSNATFNYVVSLANTVFTGANTYMGLAANVAILGSNTTHQVLSANNTTNKLYYKHLPNIKPEIYANGDLLVYNSNTSQFESGSISIDGNDLSVAGDLLLSGGVQANGAYGTAGQVLKTNGTTSYWDDQTIPTLTSLGITNHDNISVNVSGDISTSGDITAVAATLSGDLGVNDITSNNITATAISANGANLTSLPAGQLTGYISAARLSGSYDITATTANNLSRSVNSGSGLTGGGTLSGQSVTISHDNTSALSNTNNSGGTIIQNVSVDNFGHLTGVTTATLPTSSGSTISSTLFATSYADAGSYEASLRTALGTVPTNGLVVKIEYYSSTFGDPTPYTHYYVRIRYRTWS